MPMRQMIRPKTEDSRNDRAKTVNSLRIFQAQWRVWKWGWKAAGHKYREISQRGNAPCVRKGNTRMSMPYMPENNSRHPAEPLMITEDAKE